MLVILLKFHKNFDLKDFDLNSSVFQSENLMTMEFLWNSRKLQKKFNQYSDRKIRWPRNSYEILENYRKSLDIPKIPTSAYSSKTFSSLFFTIFRMRFLRVEHCVCGVSFRSLLSWDLIRVISNRRDRNPLQKCQNG